MSNAAQLPVSTPAASAARHLPIPRLSVGAGLWRYRQDRLDLLTGLGDAGRDLVESELGPLRLVIVTDAAYARAVLVDHADAFRKGPALTRDAIPVLGNGLLTSLGAAHRQQRKCLAPKFTPRHIAGYAEAMAALTGDMLARWRTRAPHDFAHEIAGLTMRIAARTMFGADISDQEIDTLGKGLDIANRWVAEEATALVHPPLRWPSPRNRRMRAALAEMDAIVYRLIHTHRARGASDDVLSALLAAEAEAGGAADDTLVRDEVMTFFVAGHETVATALAWGYHLLSRHPAVAGRVAMEADRVLAGQRPAAGAVRDLLYTQQVFSEILRMYPPLYNVGRQALADVQIGPHRIRRGAYVAINIMGMHRRADYFAQPTRFLPERFAAEPSWPRGAYIPFGLGPRVCIGNHFAIMEGTLILALLARSIELRGAAAPIAADPLLTLRPRGGVPMQLAWRTP